MTKKLILYSLLCFMPIALCGCTRSRMTRTKTLSDGTVVKYEVKVDIFGQDLAGTDLSATLDPDGKNTIKAGAVNTATSQMTADVAASMVELVRLMLPYLVTVPEPAP